MKEHITTFDLSRYLEKDLDESEAQNIENHCSTCETCTRELDFLKKMISCSAMLKDSKVSDIAEFVKQTIQKRNKPQRKIVTIRNMLLPVSAAAALIIIAGTGLFIDHDHSKPIKVSMDFSAVQPEQPRVDYEDVVGSSTSVKSIVSTLKSNGAKVTKVGDGYVEAEVSYDDYQRIRSEFGFAVLPAGFIGDSVDLAASGNDTSIATGGSSPIKALKIRIRR
jgi:anti-sigma factor RsiW